MIFNEIKEMVSKGVELAIENNDRYTLNELTAFIEKMLIDSVKHLDEKQHLDYIYLPPSINRMVMDKVGSQDLQNKELGSYAHTIPSNILKDLMMLPDNIRFANVKAESDLDTVYNQFYECFNAFSAILYQCVEAKNIGGFKTTISDFTVSSSRADRSVQHFLNRYSLASNGQRFILDLTKGFQTLQRRMLTGIKYWINFLRYEQFLTAFEFNEISELIRIPINESNQLLEDIIFVFNLKGSYLNWTEFTFYDLVIERSRSKVSLHDWMMTGFLIECLRNGSFFINFDRVDSKQKNVISSLYQFLYEKAKEMIKKPEKLMSIVELSTSDALNISLENILNAFKPAFQERYKAVENEVMHAGLSIERINEFKNRAYVAWERQARIRKIFERWGNYTQIPSQGHELVRVGKSNFLERGRIAFIEGSSYSRIIGLEDLAALVGRTEDEVFFHRVDQSLPTVITGGNAVEVIQTAISRLIDRGIEADIIITSPEFAYQNEKLLSSPNFVAIGNLITDAQDIQFLKIGTFNDIPVYTSFDRFVSNKFLICNFRKAFEMEYKLSFNKIQGPLTVSVREPGFEETKIRYSQNPETGSRVISGESVDDDEALILMRTSIIIDLWSIVDFKILDVNAFVVAELG